VRRGEHRAAAPDHLPQRLQDQVGVLGVDLRDRLVGEDHLGLADQGPRDRDPLLLPGGQLERPVVHPVDEPEPRQPRLGPSLGF
jgi:hypothetical protein